MEKKFHEANTVGTQEAGRMLGLQSSTVAAKCRNGEFPHAKQYKPGTPWQIPIADIEDYKANDDFTHLELTSILEAILTEIESIHTNEK